jgi:polyisoprenoid-binding protein YceI
MTDTSPASTSTATLPAPGTYVLDRSHSHVGFKVRHLVVAKVRGAFTDVDATLTVAEEPLESSVVVSVPLASVDTGDEQRDAHLRSPDFFDVEKYPEMTFRSTAVRQRGDDRYEVEGELTLHGVTRPLTLDTTLEGVTPDPWGGERVVFSATGKVNREDFGLTWNQPLETGGVLVGRDVDIEIEAELVRQA